MRGVAITCTWAAPPRGGYGQVSLQVELECDIGSDVDRVLAYLCQGSEHTTGVVSNRTRVPFRRVAAVLRHLERRAVVVNRSGFWSAPSVRRSTELLPDGRVRYEAR